MLWISIDPGDISGLFVVQSLAVPVQDKHFIKAREGNAFEIVQNVESYLRGADTRDIHLVLEGVTLPNKVHLPSKKFGQSSAIGAIHWLAELFGVELIAQDPGQRKIITNEMLQKLEWYYASPGKHMVDAAKHLVVAMLKKKLLRMEDLV